MKFRNDEVKFIIDFYRKDLKELGINDFKSKSYFSDLTCFYLHQVKDSTYGKIQIEKSKYLLSKNSKVELAFQKEMVVDVINRMLALPDEKLALTDKNETGKFMVENYNDICSLLLIDKLLGPQYNNGALKDFNIPQNVVDALKHKRDLLDASKNELPDAKYDGLYLNKNNEYVMKTTAAVVDVPVEGFAQLQNSLNTIKENNGRFERDSFDDFLEMVQFSDSVSYAISKEDGISDESKREFSSFFNKFTNVRSQLNSQLAIYGQNSITYNQAANYSAYAEAINAVKTLPRKLINSIPKESSAYAKFMGFYNKIMDTEVVRGSDTEYILDNSIKKQSVKTLYANIDVLRCKLNAMGYTKPITDHNLVSQVNEYMLSHPKQGESNCIDDALVQITRTQRTVAEELTYQQNKVKQLSGKNVNDGWGLVANGIAKIELLKSMPSDQIIDFDKFEKDSVEFLKANPNISLNASMHSREIINGYFANPTDFINNFHFEDAKVKNVNLNSIYDKFRQDVEEQIGELDCLPPDKVFGPNDALREKAYKLAAREERISPIQGLVGDIYKSYQMPTPSAWARLFSYYCITPSTKEDVVQNYTLAKNFIENKVQPSGLTFRQQMLTDSIEILKNLDAAELSDISDEKLIENWPKINKTWGLAFVARIDLLHACKEEGLVISDADKEALSFINDQSTLVYQNLRARKELLCNQYSPLTEGMTYSQFDELTLDNSYGTGFCGIQERGILAKEQYQSLSNMNKAFSNAGIYKIKDVANTKLAVYNSKGEQKESDFRLDIITKAYDSNAIFSITEPGKNPVFLRCSGSTCVMANTYKQMQEYLKPHDVTMHINTAKEYENSEYLDAFIDANERLTDKITNGVNISKEDIARVLVMQNINISLRNHAGDEDEYHIALQSFVNEDYIKYNINSIIANPAFDKLVDKMGGLDEQGFIKRQNQQSYLNINALEDFQKINAEIIQGKETDGWNKSLDKDASLAKIDEYKAMIENDLPSLYLGSTNAAYYRCQENVFRIALLQKNIDENLNMTTKQIEDKANALAFDEGYKRVRESVLSGAKVSFAAHGIIEPKEGYYPWAKRVYKLVDRCEEVKKEGFETDDMFVERKLFEAGITDQDAIRTAKESFASLSQTNNLLRYGNPDKALSNEELWQIQNDKVLTDNHEISKDQIQKLHGNLKLKENVMAKSYIARSFSYNVNDNPVGLEKIKEDKASVLLKSNTGEALQFQKEYVTEMINKMLAIPDDKLAMHGTPEARQYYADHYKELYMLFEVENFMGGTELAKGVRNDFDIPQEIVEVLRHKKNLAQENVLGEEGFIKTFANDDYRVHSILDKASTEELSQMQSVQGDFAASQNIVNLVPQLVLARVNQVNRAVMTMPDKRFDGYQLNPKDVKIKARFENEKSYSDIADEFSKRVDESEITINDKYQVFARKVESTGADFANQLKELDKAQVFKELKKSCDEYVDSIVTKARPFSSLDAPDKEAIKYAKQLSGFCKEKIAYHTMKDNVFKMETELGIKDHSLDLEMNTEKEYTLEDYGTIIANNRSAVENVVTEDIRRNKAPRADYLARLVVLDTINNQISKNAYPKEYIHTFLNEEYVQRNANEINACPQFKSLLLKNQPTTEQFVKSNLSEMLANEVREMKAAKELENLDKQKDLPENQEIKATEKSFT